MSLYNIEIFDENMNFILNQAVEDITYEFDYLSLDRNKIKIMELPINGYFIRIFNDDIDVGGIIEKVSESDTFITIEYKSLLSICDINIYLDTEKCFDNSISMERVISDIITEYFVNTEDVYQKYPISIKCRTQTYGDYRLSFNNSIINLYTLITELLIKYDIVVNFHLDLQRKGISCDIYKHEADKIYIEADLPNIIKKNISYNSKTDKSVNKLIIMNENNVSEKVTYYLKKTGKIEKEPASERILPVILSTECISVSEDFESEAYITATKKLSKKEYNNLIEVEVNINDSMIKPMELDIGQQVIVISKSYQYLTILTGYVIDGKKVKLIFGSVREELTKKIKRRLNSI